MQMRKTLRHSRLFCSVFRDDLQNSVLCIIREHSRFFTMAAEETCRNDTSMEEATGSAERVENEAAHGSQFKNGSSAAVADVDYPSAEELVAKARAPVKQEYICSAPLRSADARDDGNGAPVKISAEKKSRRQLKRERKQEANQKICVAVAKAGDVQACPYKENCRFSHDLEAFLAKKLPDLPGECPFLHTQVSCPYGPSCCFAGTHPYENSSREASEKENINEMNVLSKEFQKLLWKNAVKFPKSDAQLEKLGVLNKGKQNTKSNVKKQTDTQNGLETSINSHALSGKETVEQEVTEQDEVPPPKRSKVTEDGQPIPVSAGSGHNKPEAGAPESIQLTNKDIEAISEIDKETRLNMREKKLIDFRNKLYLAPLTTVGNLPFRRLCKNLGADITCGEMAMCTNLLQGQASEWALLRRHSSEDIFGVQICAPYPDTVAHTVELIEKECTVDFIDINMGCPIDIVVNKGAGSCILTKPKKMYNMIKAAAGTMENTLTVKVRMGYFEGRNCIHSMISDIGKAGAAAITIHGRTRQQRYSKLPDWDYIHQCVNEAAEGIQVIGNGDIFAYTDWNDHMNSGSNLSSCMIGRGALIKPWIFTEIKEQRHWDISSSERLDLLKDYVRFGLQHWGSDKKGVETTRRFLLEWLSYLCRYIPVGLLDIVPQRINWRPPSYFGRNDLETLMASDSAADWVRISEMLLGPVPAGFTFTPKHKSNAYDRAENG